MEQPTVPFPVEGSSGDDTYVGSAALVGCTSLVSLPAIVPWNPTVGQAMALCSSMPTCGGFLYTVPQAALASGGAPLAAAAYCQPGSFTSGANSSTSAVGYARRLYKSCDQRLTVKTSIAGFYGVLSAARAACVTLGRGLTASRDRTPKPNVARFRPPPVKTATIGGVDYVVGRDVFRAAADARSFSADGLAHQMQTDLGAVYYMPAAAHLTRGQPAALDGYYPLYGTQAAAEAASAFSGGTGFAVAVGPTTALGRPAFWTEAPHTATYYMPADGPVLFRGDYVAPLAKDGYFPLYRNETDARRVSADGTALSFGPGASTGVPRWWSSGETAIYYMPAVGQHNFYGNYTPPGPQNRPLYRTSLPTAR